MERGHRQCPGCGGRTCTKNDPALVHQARNRPLFGRNAGVGERIEDGIVVCVLARTSLQGQPGILVDRINPPEHQGELREQGLEQLGRNAQHNTTEDREKSVGVEPYSECRRAVLDVVGDVSVLSEVVVALAKVTMADGVSGQVCEKALELHRLICGLRTPELLA